MKKVQSGSIFKFGDLILELLGKGVVLSKGQIAETSRNYCLMPFLLEEAKKINYYSPWLDEKYKDKYQDDIEALNVYLCQWLSNLGLDRDENADNCHIYNKETQGLNTLLVMLLDIFYEAFKMKENN